jgi:hypothetical protein
MGTVTSVSASSFSIKSLGTKATTKVTTSSATVYRKQATAKASDVTTGRCILAFGRPAGSVVDASSVAISSPTNGQCKTAATTAGPRGFAGGPGGGATGEGGGTTYG